MAAVDKQGRPVRFIRKRGKVIPIRVKRPVGRPKGSLGIKKRTAKKEWEPWKQKTAWGAAAVGATGISVGASFGAGRIEKRATLMGKGMFKKSEFVKIFEEKHAHFKKKFGKRPTKQQQAGLDKLAEGIKAQKKLESLHRQPLRMKIKSLRNYRKGLLWAGGTLGATGAAYATHKLFNQKRGRGRPSAGSIWWRDKGAGGTAAAVALGAGTIAYGVGKSKLGKVAALGKEIAKYAKAKEIAKAAAKRFGP